MLQEHADQTVSACRCTGHLCIAPAANPSAELLLQTGSAGLSGKMKAGADDADIHTQQDIDIAMRGSRCIAHPQKKSLPAMKSHRENTQEPLYEVIPICAAARAVQDKNMSLIR